MRRVARVALIWAVLGASVAVVLLSVALTLRGSEWWWDTRLDSLWEQIMIVLCPSSIMMMATETMNAWESGIVLVIVILTNAILYALFGLFIHLLVLGAKSAKRPWIQ